MILLRKLKKGSLKHGNSEIRRARKTLVVGSLLLHGGLAQPKWHWPASLKIGICLIEMFVPLVFFHLSKIRALHEEPIFVHSAMHLNGSEMVIGGLLRRIWRKHYDKRAWHGRGNLRKDIGIYGLDILWILPVVFPGKSGDLSQCHRRYSTQKTIIVFLTIAWPDNFGVKATKTDDKYSLPIWPECPCLTVSHKQKTWAGKMFWKHNSYIRY